MDAVLDSMKKRFPEKAHRLRLGRLGKSIQIRCTPSKTKNTNGKPPSYTTVCIPHCRDKSLCVQCGSNPAAKERDRAVAKSQLERLRVRFPDYDLKVSKKRIEGRYRIVRRYECAKKYYRVCLKHGRLFKQCEDCRYIQDGELDPDPPAPSSGSTKVAPDLCGASSNSNGGSGGSGGSGVNVAMVGKKRKHDSFASSAAKNQSATKGRVNMRRTNARKIQGLFRHMTEQFPQHTLRISRTGKYIQRKFGKQWTTVCALHCKEKRTCMACGFGAANNAEKRAKMLPILQDMRKRFPDYTLEISQRTCNGEYPIVRYYPNSKYPKKAYAVCIPHGKLLKQCRSGCGDIQSAKNNSIKA